MSKSKHSSKSTSSKSSAVSSFWFDIQKNDLMSAKIFTIPKEDVLKEIDGEEDQELLDQAFESIGQESGKSDWIVGKTDLKSTTNVVAASENIVFLSKLPDGVFVSGATSRALGRLRADFVIFSVCENQPTKLFYFIYFFSLNFS